MKSSSNASLWLRVVGSELIPQGTNWAVARFVTGAIQRSEEWVMKYMVVLFVLALASPASARFGMAPLAVQDEAVVQVKGGHGHGHGGHHGWHGNRGHHYGWYRGRGNWRHHH